MPFGQMCVRVRRGRSSKKWEGIGFPCYNNEDMQTIGLSQRSSPAKNEEAVTLHAITK